MATRLDPKCWEAAYDITVLLLSRPRCFVGAHYVVVAGEDGEYLDLLSALLDKPVRTIC